MDNEIPDEPLEKCAFSGEMRPCSEMLQYGDQFVAPEYKDQFVQQLREGGEEFSDTLDCDFTPSLFLSDIIRQSVVIWCAQWKQIVVMFAILWTPLYLVLEYMSYEIWEDDVQSLQRYFRTEQAMALWVGSLVAGAIFSIGGRIWRGRKLVSLSDLWSLGAQNYVRLLGTKLLLILLVFCITLLFLIPFMALSGNDWVSAISAIVLCVVLLIALVRLGFAGVAAVAEGKGGIPAMENSWRVTKGRFWRVIGVQLTVYSLATLFAVVVSLNVFIPYFDNFVVSAFFAVAVGAAQTLVDVETAVFYQHLAANAEEPQSKEGDSKKAPEL